MRYIIQNKPYSTPHVQVYKNMENNINRSSSLEDEARKRKEKLNLLKRKRSEKSQDIDGHNSTIHLPKPKFRSYKPAHEQLTDQMLPEAQPVDVETEVKSQLDAGKSGIVIDQLDISTLAPRKVDWDLKRDVAKKLEKLERRTQKAMAEIIRERLKERQENLAHIVNGGGPVS